MFNTLSFLVVPRSSFLLSPSSLEAPSSLKSSLKGQPPGSGAKVQSPATLLWGLTPASTGEFQCARINKIVIFLWAVIKIPRNPFEKPSAIVYYFKTLIVLLHVRHPFLLYIVCNVEFRLVFRCKSLTEIADGEVSQVSHAAQLFLPLWNSVTVRHNDDITAILAPFQQKG